MVGLNLLSPALAGSSDVDLTTDAAGVFAERTQDRVANTATRPPFSSTSTEGAEDSLRSEA
jgi:hypothetical protein